MDLHHAAALLTSHAQQAGAALTQGTQRDPRRLARLAHQAERAVELAVSWDGVLWEAHGTHERDLFPLTWSPPPKVARHGRTRTRHLATCPDKDRTSPAPRVRGPGPRGAHRAVHLAGGGHLPRRPSTA